MSLKKFSPMAGVVDNDASLFYGLVVKRNFRQNSVLVSNVIPTKIPGSPLSNRISLTIINNSSDTIYIGDSTVTTSNGFPLIPRSSLRIDIEDSVDVYGISDGAGTSEMRILEGS